MNTTLAGNPAPLSFTSKLHSKALAPSSVNSGNAANMNTTLAGNPVPLSYASKLRSKAPATFNSGNAADTNTSGQVDSGNVADSGPLHLPGHDPYNPSPNEEDSDAIPFHSKLYTPVDTSCYPKVPPHPIFNTADDPLPFPEEFDTNPFTPHAPPLISLIRAGAFKKLMDSGKEIFTFHYKPHMSSSTSANLRAVGNDPTPTTSLHSKPRPTDEGELITQRD